MSVLGTGPGNFSGLDFHGEYGGRGVPKRGTSSVIAPARIITVLLGVICFNDGDNRHLFSILRLQSGLTLPYIPGVLEYKPDSLSASSS